MRGRDIRQPHLSTSQIVRSFLRFSQACGTFGRLENIEPTGSCLYCRAPGGYGSWYFARSIPNSILSCEDKKSLFWYRAGPISFGPLEGMLSTTMPSWMHIRGDTTSVASASDATPCGVAIGFRSSGSQQGQLDYFSRLETSSKRLLSPTVMRSIAASGQFLPKILRRPLSLPAMIRRGTHFRVTIVPNVLVNKPHRIPMHASVSRCRPGILSVDLALTMLPA